MNQWHHLSLVRTNVSFRFDCLARYIQLLFCQVHFFLSYCRWCCRFEWFDSTSFFFLSITMPNFVIVKCKQIAQQERFLCPSFVLFFSDHSDKNLTCFRTYLSQNSMEIQAQNYAPIQCKIWPRNVSSTNFPVFALIIVHISVCQPNWFRIGV